MLNADMRMPSGSINPPSQTIEVDRDAIYSAGVQFGNG